MTEIFTRRSIRKFKDMPIEEEKLKAILKAGMNAPSAGNQQPWEFVVIRDRSRLVGLAEGGPYWSMLKECAVAIIVCGNIDKEKFSGYWVQDCSASLQNILLEAKTQGIGTVWLGTTPVPERIEFVTKFINAPSNIKPLGIVALGYGNEEKEANNKFDIGMIVENSY